MILHAQGEKIKYKHSTCCKLEIVLIFKHVNVVAFLPQNMVFDKMLMEMFNIYRHEIFYFQEFYFFNILPMIIFGYVSFTLFILI